MVLFLAVCVYSGGVVQPYEPPMIETPREYDEAPETPVLELPDVEAEWVYLVDDDPQVLRTVERLIVASGYRARSFQDPEEALREIGRVQPRILIVDFDMPGMTGIELAERALKSSPELRVIMATGAGDEETAQATLRLGFSDYLRKPIDHRELSAAVQKAFMDIARDEYQREMDSWLRAEVRRQTQAVQDVTLATLESLLNALEARSAHFKGHSQSVAVSAAGIARELDIPEPEVRAIRTAGLLHDIGMIAVPDDVVDKPGELNPDEFAAIRDHCRKGAEILEPLTHLGPVVRFVHEHHERVDGSGYPDQKRGDEISLGGQIVGLAEVWTALTEPRAYREGMTKAKALTMLEGHAGSWFSEELIAALRASEG